MTEQEQTLRIAADVRPVGRWSWNVSVIVTHPAEWIGRETWSGIVVGSRARADRHARRAIERERRWQQRLATETHTLEDGSWQPEPTTPPNP